MFTTLRAFGTTNRVPVFLCVSRVRCVSVMHMRTFKIKITFLFVVNCKYIVIYNYNLLIYKHFIYYKPFTNGVRFTTDGVRFTTDGVRFTTDGAICYKRGL